MNFQKIPLKKSGENRQFEAQYDSTWRRERRRLRGGSSDFVEPADVDELDAFEDDGFLSSFSSF